MKVAAVISDLLFYSRIAAAAVAGGADLVRVDTPSDVPTDTDLVLVDWSAREPNWIEALHGLRSTGVRVLLFGPHTDLAAHAAAREAGIGPMMARSRLAMSLGDLLRP